MRHANCKHFSEKGSKCSVLGKEVDPSETCHCGNFAKEDEERGYAFAVEQERDIPDLAKGKAGAVRCMDCENVARDGFCPVKGQYGLLDVWHECYHYRPAKRPSGGQGGGYSPWVSERLGEYAKCGMSPDESFNAMIVDAVASGTTFTIEDKLVGKLDAIAKARCESGLAREKAELERKLEKAKKSMEKAGCIWAEDETGAIARVMVPKEAELEDEVANLRENLQACATLLGERGVEVTPDGDDLIFSWAGERGVGVAPDGDDLIFSRPDGSGSKRKTSAKEYLAGKLEDCQEEQPESCSDSDSMDILSQQANGLRSWASQLAEHEDDLGIVVRALVADLREAADTIESLRDGRYFQRRGDA